MLRLGGVSVQKPEHEAEGTVHLEGTLAVAGYTATSELAKRWFFMGFA